MVGASRSCDRFMQIDVIGLPVHSVKVKKPGRKGHSNAFEHCCQYTELTVGFELKNTTGLPVRVSIIQHTLIIQISSNVYNISILYSRHYLFWAIMLTCFRITIQSCKKVQYL